MLLLLVALVVLLIVLLLLLRLWLVLPLPARIGARAVGAAVGRADDCKRRCLVVLGSGGHTAEMFYDLASLRPWAGRLQFTYLVAETDKGSAAKAEAFEAERGADDKTPSADIRRVPRAREVGQSYVSSVFTTLKAALASARVVLWELPDIVFANGPGTCVPVIFAAYVARVLGLRHIFVVYSESFACVEHLSLSGRLVYFFADRFTVQWPQLLPVYPRALYAGRLGKEAGDLPALRTVPEPDAPGVIPTAIVTVGSTLFDALIEAVDNPEFLKVLRDQGIRRLKVQRGAGRYQPKHLATGHDIEVQIVEYTPDLPSEMRSAALIVSHAGAGSILDCLSAGRRMVAVPNEGLMANHQVQLGMALQDQGVLLCFRTADLVRSLQEADFSALRRFPPDVGPAFASAARELLDLPQ